MINGWSYEKMPSSDPSTMDLDMLRIQAMANEKAHKPTMQLLPKAQNKPVDTVKIQVCKKLLVERVEHSTGIHYMILICEAHGKIHEEKIHPYTAWQLHQRMAVKFDEHVEQAAKAPAVSAAPSVPATTFGKLPKRKFG